MKHPQKNKAYTLIEVLVACGLFAGLSAFAWGLASSGMGSFSQGLKSSSYMHAVESILPYIEKDIRADRNLITNMPSSPIGYFYDAVERGMMRREEGEKTELFLSDCQSIDILCEQEDNGLSIWANVDYVDVRFYFFDVTDTTIVRRIYLDQVYYCNELNDKNSPSQGLDTGL